MPHTDQQPIYQPGDRVRVHPPRGEASWVGIVLRADGPREYVLRDPQTGEIRRIDRRELTRY